MKNQRAKKTSRRNTASLRARYDQLKSDFDELLEYNAALYRQIVALSAFNKTISQKQQQKKRRYTNHV